MWFKISVPLMDINEGEKKYEGVIIFEKSLDQGFIQRVSEYTGTRVNLFLDGILSVGHLKSYEKLDPTGLAVKVSEKNSGVEKAGGIFRSIDVSDESFYEGLFPLSASRDQLGVFSILLSQEESKQNARQMFYWLLAIALACLAVVTPFTWFFAGSIVKSIGMVTKNLKEIADGQGDLTQRIDVKSKDEVGEMSRWFNLFVENLQSMICDISKSSAALSQFASITQEQSNQISSRSTDMVKVTQTVTTATTQMSSSTSSISKVIGKASDNIDLVASSTEEMTTTINDIAKKSENARTMSIETGHEIENAVDHVSQLEKDAKQIHTFTEVISDISEQTNLLALNATIEAARAGDAGKGFAVVAGEIKDLAGQTADATQDIKTKIEAIKTSTDLTINEMKNISQAFGAMNMVVTEIAGAIEEQTATTGEISRNTLAVASRINEVNSTVSQFDKLTTDIAKDMKTVNTASSQMSENCSHINSDSGKMHQETGKLDELIHKFVIE